MRSIDTSPIKKARDRDISRCRGDLGSPVQRNQPKLGGSGLSSLSDYEQGFPAAPFVNASACHLRKPQMFIPHASWWLVEAVS